MVWGTHWGRMGFYYRGLERLALVKGPLGLTMRLPVRHPIGAPSTKDQHGNKIGTQWVRKGEREGQKEEGAGIHKLCSFEE